MMSKPLRLFASLVLCAACSKAPSLSIDSPAAGAKLTAADDLDPQAPSLQIAVDATTSAADGSLAWAAAGDAPVSARVSGGHLHFVVTVPDGNQTLSVSVGGATVSVPVFADSLASGCRFVAPEGGSTVTADPGDTGLVSVPVVVQCRGLAAGAKLRLFSDTEALGEQQALDASGSATFTAQLLPGDNLFTLVGPGLGAQELRVKLASVRCRAELSPASGTLFNAARDLNPAETGEQAQVVVASGCPDGTPVQLVVKRAGQTLLSPVSALAGGKAVFTVTLPEGELQAQAFVGPQAQPFAGAPGTSGASRVSRWTVDSLLPAVALAAPLDGAFLDDSQTVNGQVIFAGQASGLASGAAWLALDEGTNAGGRDLLLAPDPSGSFRQAVSLANGPHVVRVVGVRPSGNRAESKSIAFAVEIQNGHVSIVSPLPGAALNLSSLTPTATGARAVFQVHTDHLAGGVARVDCSGTSSARVSIPASGDVSVPIDLPLPSCAAAQLSCTASASLSAPGSAVFSSPAIAITADAVAPVATLISPPARSTTKASTVAVQATTSCPGEAQTWELRNNGALVASGAVAANVVDVAGVALSLGDNQLDLAVLDANRNQGAATAHVIAIAGTATVAIVSPAPSATLTAADDVDGDLSNGLQALVRVQVGNRPAGTVVDLTVASVDAGNAPRSPLHASTVASGAAVFPAVSMPEGNVAVTACVTDPISPPPSPVCATVQIVVSTGRAVCNVVAPADGAVLTGASDTRPDLPGYQNDLRVQTSGDGTIALTLTGPSGAPQTLSMPAPSGTGLRIQTFSSVTFSGGDGTYSVDATCAATAPVAAGRALTNVVTLQTAGPAVTFVAPTGTLNASAPNTSTAPGFHTDVKISTAAGTQVTLGVQCSTGPAGSYGPLAADASGNVTFAGVTLLQVDGTEATCTLTAQAGQGLPKQLTILVDRSLPAPSFSSPQLGVTYGPTAAELDCSKPAAPVLKSAQLALTDAVPASGLTLYVQGAATSLPATVGSGSASFANVPLANGSNTLGVVAVDAAGNRGTAQVSFIARCTTDQVALSLFASTNKLGWAQNKDHSTPGEHIGVQISANVPDGTIARVCSTLGDTTQAPCETAGAYPVPGTGTVASGAATFDVTFADGVQTIVGEVVSAASAPSATKAITVRATPPVVSAIAIAENDADLSLNAAELAPTLHFQVAASGAIAGQTMELHSTALGTTVLGSAPAVVGTTTVAVPLSAVSGSGGYQQHVFYALVHDDAANPNSIPGSEYPNQPATTLGTAAQPFVIAPLPTASLDRPAVARLLAADDTRCGATCPGTDPLSYKLAGSSNAPDGSTAQFLLNGAAAGAAITFTAGAVSAITMLPNGPAQQLAVRVSDPFGNVVTSGVRTVLIDSVPPSLSLGASSTITSVPATVTVQTGTSLEANQTITITSDKDGVVGTAPCVSNGATSISISLSTNGPHQLVASAKDAAGNPGSSPAVSTTFNYAGPTIALSQPTPSSSTITFGSASASGGKCAPVLQVSTGRVPDGTNVRMWVASSADCTAAAVSPQLAPVSSNQATFTNLVTFADRATGFLCADVTYASKMASTSPQAIACDLSAPTVAWATPAAGQLYVAPPLGSRMAIASQGSDPLTLVADFSLTATARAGSTVALDDAGAGFASQTLSADCNACTVSFTAASLPVAAAKPLGHTLNATVTSPGSNKAAAARAVQIDINPPADAQAQTAVQSRLGGVLRVSVTAPGDDGTTGPAAAMYQVRWSTATPLTRANWETTGTLLAQALLPAPAAPGAAQTFGVVVPADSASVWLGVRAVDRAGNLGGFTDQTSTPTAALQLTRTVVTVPLAANRSGNVAGRMRVADVDGDGFDDVIVVYPNDGAGPGDGRIFVFFGAAGGLNATPLALDTGIPTKDFIPGGLMGYGGLSFDVGDFDGDGLADIVAGATDCGLNAKVYVWTGAAIKAAGRAAPAPVVLTDGANLLGGTLRAAGHASGGATAGDDLLVSNYNAGCGTPASFSLALLPRGGAWLKGGSATLASAVATITLPSGHPLGTVDATAIDVLEGGTSAQSVFVAFIDNSTTPEVRELRTVPGSALAGTVTLTASGKPIAVPTGGGTDFGRYVAGGLDATGDGKGDLALSGQKRVFLYDGATLLGASPAVATVLDVSSDNVASADVGYCAQLLPNLLGDGLAALSGCANLAQAPNAYYAFGGSGPSLSFFPGLFAFSPQRGQRLKGSGAAFGQKIAAGHVSSKTGRDLVVLSENGTTAQFELLR